MKMFLSIALGFVFGLAGMATAIVIALLLFGSSQEFSFFGAIGYEAVGTAASLVGWALGLASGLLSSSGQPVGVGMFVSTVLIVYAVALALLYVVYVATSELPGSSLWISLIGSLVMGYAWVHFQKKRRSSS